jgi:hypothetical protein
MFRNIFKGKYGIDNLTIVLVLGAAIFFNIKYLWIIGFILLGYAVFRSFSTNTSKRYAELQKFNKILFVIIKRAKGALQWTKNEYNFNKLRIQQRKQYAFLKCPKCKKVLRLPKHKGKLKANCPVCKYEFFRKT